MLIRHLWQLKRVVFLHWCVVHAVLLQTFLGKLCQHKDRWEKTCSEFPTLDATVHVYAMLYMHTNKTA